jgi:hypothetical protein
MGLAHSPKVVTDSLALYIDTINTKSYPGSGNTLYNIVNTDNVSVVGGLVSTNNAINMAGSTNYIDFTIPNFSTSVCTVEIVAKLESLNNVMPFGWLRYDVFCSANNVGYNTASSDVYGLSGTQTADLGMLNNIKHYVFVMRSDVSYSNNKIYVNGQAQSLAQRLAAENTGNRNFNSGSGRIAGWRHDTNYRMPMELYLFKVYTRELSSDEVQQNFNAIRGRFGI